MSDNYDTYEHIIPTETEVESKRRFPVVTQLSVLALLLVAIFAFGASMTELSPRHTSSPQQPLSTDNNASDAIKPIPALADLTLTAESVFVFDVATQRVLYSKNPDVIRPIASITKLMTNLVAHELVTNDQWVRIPHAASVLESTSGLVPGELFTQQSLRDFAMISSSNDAAHAIATAVGSVINPDEPVNTFVTAMNIRADELGLTTMEFQNTTGLDVNENAAGAVGTARDVSFLLQHILQNYPEILEPTTVANARIYTDTGSYYEAVNTNRQLANLPQLLGSKTGYTTLAGGNLTIAYDTGFNRPIIITVLGSSFMGRFDDVNQIVAAVEKNLLTTF